MRNAGSLTGPVDEVLDVYFRQCSLLVTAADLATMAATLANGGVNPVTGEEVVDRAVTAHVLTVMATCGMYDYAGEWLLRVGLPGQERRLRAAWWRPARASSGSACSARPSTRWATACGRWRPARSSPTASAST